MNIFKGDDRKYDKNIKYIGKCLLIETGGKKILVIGDMHLGYEEALNRAGVMVNRILFKESIEELDKIFSHIGNVDEIVFLGDVKHDFGRLLRQEMDEIPKLFNYLEDKCKRIVISQGNHDVIIKSLVMGENVELKDYYMLGEYCFVHGDRDFDEIHDKNIRYWIVGHGHPAVKISDGIKVEKYKCFLSGEYEGKRIIVVPSFFGLVEGSDPRENDLGLAWKFNYGNFEVKIIGKNLEVLDFGKLGNLK